jgi:hypothetical protein
LGGFVNERAVPWFMGWKMNGFIPIPNAFIDECMSRLSGNALRVYLALKRHSGGQNIFGISAAKIKKSGLDDIRSVKSGLKELSDYGYTIKHFFLSDDEAYEFLKKGNFNNGCLFCGYDNSFLDGHHYPVRRKDGGDRVIDICANCHREFHTLTDFGRYKLEEGGSQ